MKAEFANLEYIFRRTYCHVVPRYQRPYVWKQAEWSAMWSDVRAAALEAERAGRAGEHDVESTHFIGAIVLEPLARERRVNMVGVVDGQQRLTTLQVLLAAARAVADEHGADEASQAFASLTSNDSFVVPADHPLDALKVWPARWDFDAFADAVIGWRRPGAPAPSGRVTDARAWFEAAVADFVREGDDPAERLNALQGALRERIGLVEITLAPGEEAQVIFETLNSRGAPLLPADLVKNTLFRQAVVEGEDVEALYDTFWAGFDHSPWTDEVTTGRIRRTRIDVLMSHWLTLRRADEVAVEHLYAEYKQWAATTKWTSREVMTDLTRHARVLDELEALPRTDPAGRLVQRLAATKTTTPMPLLLHLYERDDVPREQRLRAVAAIDSFLVRRSVCSLTTSDYNRLFLAVLKVVVPSAGQDAGDTVVRALAGQDASSRFWPSDHDFIDGLLHDAVYHRLKGPRLRTLLVGIEEHLRDGLADQPLVGTDDLTVEHLLPQKWRQHWPVTAETDGVEVAEGKRDKHVHQLGNLTLTTGRLNSQLSHSPWHTKREALRPKSTLLITTASVLTPPEGVHANTGDWAADWDEGRIALRTMWMAHQALKAWPRPDPDSS